MLRGLLNSWFTCRSPEVKSSNNDEPDINELSFTELRDKLLALDPLNKDHVIKVNEAEAEFRKKSEGYRVGWSDEILGFDCGGQQWVSETCYPAGTLSKPSMKDLEFIEELKRLIEKEDIPAPAPIEQRWTARSKSPMSPASSPAEDDIFSWVHLLRIFHLIMAVCVLALAQSHSQHKAFNNWSSVVYIPRQVVSWPRTKNLPCDSWVPIFWNWNRNGQIWNFCS